MRATILFGFKLCAVIMTCQGATTEDYKALLASINDIPYPESDGTQLPVTYLDGRKRTYTRDILDSFLDTLVGGYKSVVSALGFDVSYKTSSGTEVEATGVIMYKGPGEAEIGVVGAFSYNVGETVVTNMWTAGINGHRAHVIFRNRGTIMPKVIESLLG